MFDLLCSAINELHIPVFRLAVLEDGEINEKIFNTANDCNNIYSVSKNFTATAIGIASDRGLIKMTDTVYDILYPEFPGLLNESADEWKTVTVEQVLTQTVGNPRMFLDMDTENIFSYGTEDFLAKVLSEPFAAKPGERMVYSDSNYYLASRLVSAATGEKMQDFLSRELFRPLEIQGWAWSCCPFGYAMGGTRLFITVTDMVKFGQLYLNNGIFDGERILSEEWVKYATSDIVWRNEAHTQSYGAGFWRNEKAQAYHCGGMYGQKIFIDPSAREVVAWQAYAKQGETDILLKMLYERAKRKA